MVPGGPVDVLLRQPAPQAEAQRRIIERRRLGLTVAAVDDGSGEPATHES